MKNEQLNVLAGWILLCILLVSEVWLLSIVKKSWVDYRLRARNYLFLFCIFSGLASLYVVVTFLLNKVGIFNK